MKQRITIAQLRELSPAAMERLRAWWKPQESDLFYDPRNTGTYGEREGTCGVIFSYDTPPFEEFEGQFEERGEDWHPSTSKRENCLPLLSIGHMIELLDEHDYLLEISRGQISDLYYVRDRRNNISKPRELCDALWDAAKAVFENERTNGGANG